MAVSQFYPLAKQSFLTQSPALIWSTDTMKCVMVDLTADYTFSAAHQFKSSVTSYAGTTDQTLANKSSTTGLVDADDITFAAVSQSSSKTLGALVIYKDTGTASTSPLFAFITGFTVIVPNGGDIAVSWDNGTNRIAQI